MLYIALTLQAITLLYHQLTTQVDLFPFNGIRHYTVQEHKKEA